MSRRTERKAAHALDAEHLPRMLMTGELFVNVYVHPAVQVALYGTPQPYRSMMVRMKRRASYRLRVRPKGVA